MTRPRTAEELLAQLGQDREFLARREERDRALEQRSDALRVEEAPLLADLRAQGYDVASVWDLVNSSTNYANLIPLLMTHLAKPYSSPIREGIARALGISDAVREWEALEHFYRVERDLRVKDGLAAALSAVADDSIIGRVIDLALDENNGASRMLLLRALAKSRNPKAREALMALRNNPVFEKEAVLLLRTFK